MTGSATRAPQRSRHARADAGSTPAGGRSRRASGAVARLPGDSSAGGCAALTGTSSCARSSHASTCCRTSAIVPIACGTASATHIRPSRYGLHPGPWRRHSASQKDRVTTVDATLRRRAGRRCVPRPTSLPARRRRVVSPAGSAGSARPVLWDGCAPRRCRRSAVVMLLDLTANRHVPGVSQFSVNRRAGDTSGGGAAGTVDPAVGDRPGRRRQVATSAKARRSSATSPP